MESPLTISAYTQVRRPFVITSLKMERFDLAKKWVGRCELNFWPGQNPDARVADTEAF